MRRSPCLELRPRTSQRGVSLLETLVAALVLAMGVLGTALLFLHGLQLNRAALSRSEAVSLATDLAERIRANPAGRAAYAPGGRPAGAAGRRALADLAEWRSWIATYLPPPVDGSAASRVEFSPGGSPATPDRYRIRVAWSDPGSAAVWDQWQIVDSLAAGSP
jgi:type IV pilus assembly protein PilV